MKADAEFLYDIKAKSWMGDLIEEKPNITVGDLIIPGTHDSAAYTLIPFYGAKTNYLNRLAIIPIFGRIFRSIASISVITQKLTIKEQLEAGARSLDLRLMYSEHPAPGQFCLAHGVTCISLQTCMNDLNAFMQENPNEMLIVNIKPEWSNKETLTDERKAALGLLLTEAFQPYLWKTEDQSPLLNQPLANLKGKIVFSLTDLPVNPHVGLHKKDSLTNANWANKPRVADCFSEGQKFFEKTCNDRTHLIEIDSAPTPSTHKGTALILYRVLSALQLYEVSCLILTPFKKLFQHNPDSTVQYFIEAINTTLEKNGQAIRQKLIEEAFQDLNRGGIIFPSDFFCDSSATQFMGACIEKSKALAGIFEEISTAIPAELDDKKELEDFAFQNDLNLTHDKQTFILSAEAALQHGSLNASIEQEDAPVAPPVLPMTPRAW